MLDPRRQRYLHAMGVSVWTPRESRPHPPGGLPDARESRPDPEEADLDELRRMAARCTRCPLHRSRTRSVFGTGPRSAPFMVVGEGPGAQEDRQGEPFVGRAGVLLEAMLFALGISRESIYITNIVKCRPPKNRDPRPDEAAGCAAYLRRQIALVAPRAILAVGRVAAQHLLSSKLPLGRLRGTEQFWGDPPLPVVVTYHPAYLLRTPHDKGKAWQDLKRLRALLGA